MKSREVRVRAIQVNQLAKRKKSYTVRWSVANDLTSRTFVTRALADRFRSELMQAVNNGEAFDIDTGLPGSMTVVKDSLTVFAFAERYLRMKWPGAAAKTRDSTTDALSTILPVLTRDLPGRPESGLLRRSLRGYGLAASVRQLDAPPEVAAALRWLERASLPLSDLVQPAIVRAVLDAVSLQLDGRPAAASTTRRKRSVFYNLLQYAVELELLDYNPVDKLRVRSNRGKKVVDEVDRRVVANPRQVRELLSAVTYVGSRGTTWRGPRLRAFFACLYFGALRPGEALGLRELDCHLPGEGWGSLTLVASRPAAGKRYTDSGEVHDHRGLKHRGDDEARTVPIPPELVTILREHIDAFGVGSDGRLFRSEHGNPVASSTVTRVWRAARELGLPPAKAASPLAGRPYDLRHGGVSLWLNAGVPAPDVAERAGHSVDVLLKVYAKCLDGNREIMNARIEEALTG